jgi:ribosomal protein L13E
MASHNRAIVYKKSGETRRGRGFSRQELIKAGISPRQALNYGLSIDTRRRTVNDQNVKLVKRYLKANVPKKKPR